jgi:uncharacterized protein (DUF488 family)
MTIYTIGHSTRELDEFVGILRAYKIGQLIDVRSVPKSSHTPQFNEDNLQNVLPKHEISYQHLEKLGGLRHTAKDSVNQGWHNASFRGYADYMQTNEFASGLEALLHLAKENTAVIMCAEAVPWRCHRSLIGDALLVRGHRVLDNFDARKTQAETLTSFARVGSLVITYPAPRGQD